MPLGIQRLNAKKSQPNDRIVFIKPLKGPDEAVAQDFLERIAAQCLPIMREHHLSVMSLEEYEPNAEFVGRNFNAGEVIQLVLKARFTGRWLPFNYVQMVMMHELAHCKQMNHSKSFWAVRNQYADQMRLLWNRGYAGEGLWGRGALLGTGEWEKNTVQPGEILPEHLCGGTYRSRGRKRKAKKTLTYQEQKERRILRKFGANGVALGEDKETKAKLEKGRRVAAKPRVAGSARGRELRAAAALARFDQPKEAKVKEETGDDDETASEAETESGEDYDDDSQPDATGADGTRILDERGGRMVKVCGDENENPSDDQDAQNELRELQASSVPKPPSRPALEFKHAIDTTPVSRPQKPRGTGTEIRQPKEVTATDLGSQRDKKLPTSQNQPEPRTLPAAPDLGQPTLKLRDSSSRTCPVCSFGNEKHSITCGMCANVLDPDSVVNSWRCQSEACVGSIYLNAGDCGVCGVCYQRRPLPS